MKDVRRAMLVVLTLSGLFAAIVGFFIVYRQGSNTAWARLPLDIGFIIAIHFIVRAYVAPPRATATQITDALRELARGHYHKRLDAESFGDLTEAAHAFNELAGVMSDRLDPHVGVVRYRPQLEAQEGLSHHSYHPELGSVRPLENQNMEESTAADSHKEAREEVQEEAREEVIEDKNPTIIEEHTAEEATEAPPALSPIPTEEDMQKLHVKYNAIRTQFDLEQVEYEELRTILVQTAEQLLQQHQCRAVSFEVQPQNGDVALLPKLVR